MSKTQAPRSCFGLLSFFSKGQSVNSSGRLPETLELESGLRLGEAAEKLRQSYQALLIKNASTSETDVLSTFFALKKEEAVFIELYTKKYGVKAFEGFKKDFHRNLIQFVDIYHDKQEKRMSKNLFILPTF